MKKYIYASEIKEGMKIYVQGYLMEVKEVMKVTYQEGGTGTYFKGYCVNKEDDIYNTGYNGGNYGSIDSHKWTIETE
jgi:hypothetical protein